jgi:phage/plasmid-associated DNA primase
LALLTRPLDGMGPAPEIRKVHKKRCVAFTEPHAEDVAAHSSSREPVAVQLSQIKRLTGEPAMTARDCSSNDPHCDISMGLFVIEVNAFMRLVGKPQEDAVRERLVAIEFPISFTDDAAVLASNPRKYRQIDDTLKDKDVSCALLRLLLRESPTDKPYVDSECRALARAYTEEQAGADPVGEFVRGRCVREEASPYRHFLTVADMRAAFDKEHASGRPPLKRKQFKRKLQELAATKNDFRAQNEESLQVGRSTPRNPSEGLLHWRLSFPLRGCNT